MVNLSLIVPVYNVENYIIECLNSIVKIIPSDGSTEVIIINDGSLDNSINLAENYILNLNDNIKNNFHIFSTASALVYFIAQVLFHSNS